METRPQRFAYQSMGTSWEVMIWDQVDEKKLRDLRESILEQSRIFDETYSRFRKDSLIWKLSQIDGVCEVPEHLTTMLSLYMKLNALSHGKLNPLIGNRLSDLGYDAEYSLTTREHIRSVPKFQETLTIVDSTHIHLREKVLIDLGALGKGYFVDILSEYLGRQGISRFLVNGSGDISYSGNGESIRAGLEDPSDPTKVIGVLPITNGALCASAGGRRAWGKYNHTIDPDSIESPTEIIATWVKADSAALADGLCTCFFMTDPSQYAELSFEYCLLNRAYKIKRSAGFTAELF